MAAVHFFKVTTLPSTPIPDAFYYVENGDYAEAYLTDNTGTLKKLGNTTMIQALTQSIDAGFFS